MSFTYRLNSTGEASDPALQVSEQLSNAGNNYTRSYIGNVVCGDWILESVTLANRVNRGCRARKGKGRGGGGREGGRKQSFAGDALRKSGPGRREENTKKEENEKLRENQRNRKLRDEEHSRQYGDI
jgi:hypothetical protein